MGYVGWGLVAEQANTTTGGAQRTVGITSSPGAGIAQSSLNSVNNGGGGVVNNYGAVWDNLFVRQYLFGRGEQGAWFDPSDFQPNWRRNLLTWTEQFDNAVWTKSNSFIQTNLLTWSEQFDNAAWTNTIAGTGVAATVTADQGTAPDGTNTADRIQFNLGGGTTTSDITRRRQSYTTPASSHTFSVYLRSFDGVSSYNMHIVGPDGATNNIVVTGAWQRFTATAIGTGAAVAYAVGLRGGQTPANSNTADVLVWGAQLVQGSVPGDYQQTTSAAAAVQYSAPDGTITAEKLAANTTAGVVHGINERSSSVTLSPGQTVFSVYAKAAGYNWVRLRVYNGAVDKDTWFDLANGVVGTVASDTTATILSVGNGWYRCTSTVAIGSTLTTIYASQIFPSPSNNTLTYTGDGTFGIYIWGAQLEVGSTATAYQPITDGIVDYFTYQPQPILYQDSAGTTPVTALEQPCGLMLDKSKGLQLGPELVTNGNFSAGTTGWATWNANAQMSVANGQMTITQPVGGNQVGVGNSVAYTTVVGRTYQVSLDVISYVGSQPPQLRIGNFNGAVNTTSMLLATGTGRRTAIFTANTTATFVNVATDSSAGNTVTFDNISVRELPGNHAYQTTSAKRPVVSARVNLLTYTEQFDNAAWQKGNATVTANAATAPDGTLTADALVEDTASSPHRVFRDVSVVSTTATLTRPFTYSVYLKPNTRLYAVLGIGNARFTRCIVNLSTGVAGAFSGAEAGNLSISINSVGNGWWLAVISGTYSVSDSPYVWVGPSDGTESYTGNGTSNIFAWGADFRPADQATGIIPRYQRVGAATYGSSTAAGVADYDSVGFPVYLRTDGSDDAMLTNSIDFSAGPTNPPITGPELRGSGVIGLIGTATAATYNTSTGAGSVSRIDLSNQSFVQWGSLVANGFYKIDISCQTGTIIIRSGTFSGTQITSLSAGQSATVYAIASASQQITITNTTSAGTSTFTVFSVREIDSAYAPDKMTVWAGVRKLSDAANGILVETSTAASASFPGSFNLAAPNSAAATNYGFRSGGTVSVGINSGAGVFASPITNVLTGIGDISGDSAIIRVNGSQTNNSSGDQGTGNYGNYPLYLFARNQTSLYFTGNFYGLIVRGAQTDTSLITTTEEYIANVTGFGAPVVVGTPSIGVSI